MTARLPQRPSAVPSASPSFASTPRASASELTPGALRDTRLARPIMVRAICETAGRRRAQQPWMGTMGWTPRANMSATGGRRQADARMAFARVLARSHHRAHNRRLKAHLPTACRTCCCSSLIRSTGCAYERAEAGRMPMMRPSATNCSTAARPVDAPRLRCQAQFTFLSHARQHSFNGQLLAIEQQL